MGVEVRDSSGNEVSDASELLTGGEDLALTAWYSTDGTDTAEDELASVTASSGTIELSVEDSTTTGGEQELHHV